MDEMALTETTILKALADAGLEISIKQGSLCLSFAHLIANPHDVQCTAFRAPNGSVLKFGIKVPEGQNQDKPAFVDVFVSLERDGNGVRIQHRTSHRSWHRLSWGAHASPATAIHFEEALEEIKCMARTYMVP